MAAGNQTDGQDAPPYPSQYQLLGETPSILPDVPINGAFLFLFILGAIGHALQYRTNIRRGKKFIPNAAAFAFCITRIFTTILWIVWAFFPTSIDCETASLIFGYVGIILLFIINLIFSRRIVRGQHPNFGWTMLFSVPFTIISLIVVAAIICLIVAIVLMFCTRDPSILQSALDIQRFGATLYAFVAVLPILIVGTSSLVRKLPKVAEKPVDKFGEGSMRTKIIIVNVTALLLAAGACYRAGAILAPLVPATQPPAPWLSKPVFYVFTFAIEWLVIAFWLVMRIDRRFYVPDGAWGPHSYAGGFVFAGEPGNEKSGAVVGSGGSSNNDSRRHLTRSISSDHYKRWFLGGAGIESSNNSTRYESTIMSNHNNSMMAGNKSPRLSLDGSKTAIKSTETAVAVPATTHPADEITPIPAPAMAPPTLPQSIHQQQTQTSRLQTPPRTSTTVTTTAAATSQPSTSHNNNNDATSNSPTPSPTSPTSTTPSSAFPPPQIPPKSLKRTTSILSSSASSTANTAITSRSRASISMKTYRAQRRAARESAISWGGVTREDVSDSLGESRQIVPYPGFEREEVEGLGAFDAVAAVESSAADAEGNGQEGGAGDGGASSATGSAAPARTGKTAPKEMGFDPKTGKWALRKVSTMPVGGS